MRVIGIRIEACMVLIILGRSEIAPSLTHFRGKLGTGIGRSGVLIIVIKRSAIETCGGNGSLDRTVMFYSTHAITSSDGKKNPEDNGGSC